ncbi:hypothetical protein AKJ16_DCAP22112 [Drosera capensis]
MPQNSSVTKNDSNDANQRRRVPCHSIELLDLAQAPSSSDLRGEVVIFLRPICEEEGGGGGLDRKLKSTLKAIVL